MIPNPIHKVLSTFQNFEVSALLMGGQACVFYGGVEFSRDTDFTVLADSENLLRMVQALADLDAVVIAVPRSVWNISFAATPFISAATIPMPRVCAWR